MRLYGDLSRTSLTLDAYKYEMVLRAASAPRQNKANASTLDIDCIPHNILTKSLMSAFVTRATLLHSTKSYKKKSVSRIPYVCNGAARANIMQG